MQTPASKSEGVRTIRKAPGGTIGFRLTPIEHEQLAAIAERQAVSIHEMARRLVLTSLRSEGDRHPHAMVDAVADQIVGLRADLGTTIEAILITCAGIPPEEAKRFVEAKLG